RMVEVPVHHFYRQYGESQFFNVRRVARALARLWYWWWRLVVKKEAVLEYRPKREAQLAASNQVTGSESQVVGQG
ncbi:MAG: hypothetical protein ACM3S0_10590, partial [Acidobacteriota bacterium]